MRLRHKKNAENEILSSSFCVQENVFNSEKPLCLELGMGKGRFITELSIKNKDINYIGIEKSATIVTKALNRLKEIAKINDGIIVNDDTDLLKIFNNLRFMCMDIEILDKVFNPHSVDKIYLNFSDPWPKKRHEGRRLTHHRFLSIYENLLKNNGNIEFKTDNKDLFEFSLEEIKNSRFKLLNYTYDLHNESELNKDNIMTEYEEKFSKLGNKICKLIAKI